MAVTTIVPTGLLEALHDKEVDYLADSIYGILLTSSYTPNQDSHKYESDLTLGSNEASGTGYSAGGQLLTTKSATTDTANNRQKLSSDPLSWDPSTVTARYMALVDKTPASAAANPILVIVDFGGDQSTSGTEFLITPDADGWLKLETP